MKRRRSGMGSLTAVKRAVAVRKAVGGMRPRRRRRRGERNQSKEPAAAESEAVRGGVGGSGTRPIQA
jgi:hypothetical protein